MYLVTKNVRIDEVTQNNYQKGGDEWVINIFLLCPMCKEWAGKKLPTNRKSRNMGRDKTGPKEEF